MKLSIFLAGYRIQNWNALYDSIPNVTTLPPSDYEIIFVGPYPPPPELADKENVVFIKDLGCPSRCYQRGLIACKGEYVIPAADDGVFNSGLAIDKAFEIMPKHEKGLVSFSFVEGATESQRIFGTGCNKKYRRVVNNMKRGEPMNFNLGECPSLSAYAPAHYKIIMIALIRKDFFKEVGGWDCRFEHVGVGSSDLSIRLQNAGAKVVLGGNLMDLTQEFRTPDHVPIEKCNAHDMTTLSSIYSDTSVERTTIDIDNWKLVPDVWHRRNFTK